MKRYSFAFGATGTELSEKIIDVPSPQNTQEIKVKIPDFTNSITVTFAILDSNGDTRYSISALAEPSTNVILVTRKIQNEYSYKLTLSGVAGGSGGTITVDTELEN